MAFNDILELPNGAISLPTDKVERMIAQGQLVAVERGHLARDLRRSVGEFRVGGAVLAWGGWLQSCESAGRTTLLPVPKPSLSTRIEPAAPVASRIKTGSAVLQITVTAHAAERWMERVAPHIPQGSRSRSIQDAYRDARPIDNPAEHREDHLTLRLIWPDVGVGWIELIVADGHSPIARIITIETEASHAEAFPLHTRLKWSAERRARSQAVKLGEARGEGTWSANDADGALRVVSRSSQDDGCWACNCPDFAFRAGRARVSCKHIWAVRIALGEADGGEL